MFVPRFMKAPFKVIGGLQVGSRRCGGGRILEKGSPRGTPWWVGTPMLIRESGIRMEPHLTPGASPTLGEYILRAVPRFRPGADVLPEGP